MLSAWQERRLGILVPLQILDRRDCQFSDAPLNIAFIGGLLSWILAFIMVILIVIRTLVFGDPTSGWPSLMTVILFLGGFNY